MEEQQRQTTFFAKTSETVFVFIQTKTVTRLSLRQTLQFSITLLDRLTANMQQGPSQPMRPPNSFCNRKSSLQNFVGDEIGGLCRFLPSDLASHFGGVLVGVEAGQKV
jgi:hypothetical protein